MTRPNLPRKKIGRLVKTAEMLPSSQLPIESVTCICDTREQRPLDLSPMRVICKGLSTGDYSVLGLEHLIAIERKSTQDLVNCVGRDRERFKRELERLKAFPYRALVIEANWAQIENGEFLGHVSPESVTGSLLSWAMDGLPVIMAGDAVQAGRFVSRMLYTAANRRWKELMGFAQGMSVAE